MSNDEQAIRELIAAWLRASAKGDLPGVLKLMAEDVVFLIPGQPPMRGREAFAAGFEKVAGRFRMEAESEIKEIEIAGEWAYCWTHLTVNMIPLKEGAPQRRAGFTLSILRKKPDGAWALFRDANLLTAAP